MTVSIHTATSHAQSRMQQRGIPQIVVDLLDDYGSCVRCSGHDRLIFDKAAVRRLKGHLGGGRGLRVVDRWLDVYAVVGDMALEGLKPVSDDPLIKLPAVAA